MENSKINNGGIKVFIGTSEINRVEEAVLVNSIKEKIAWEPKIFFLNGDKCTIEGPDFFQTVNIPSDLTNQYVTKFTAMRFTIPEICKYQGKALYIDSDQVVLSDLNQILQGISDEFSFAAVSVNNAYSHPRFRRLVLDRISSHRDLKNFFLASVILFNCEKCFFDVPSISESLKKGDFSYQDFIWLGPQFRKKFGLKVANLNPEWNALDSLPEGAKIVHFTDLSMQPWKFSHHPLLKFWRKFFLKTVQDGGISRNTLLNQRKHGALSWSTLMIGLSLLEKKKVDLGFNNLFIAFYDFIFAFIIESFWKVKSMGIFLLRSIR
jgi:hypothetical protein